MPWRLRSSMTMSRKSIESSCSWSRRRTSGFTALKSSSGAMSAIMSSTTFLHSSLVIWLGRLGDKPLNNQCGIYPKHPERIIKNGIHLRNLPWLVQDKSRKITGWIEVIHVDGRMHHKVVEGREVSRQLECTRCTHA